MIREEERVHGLRESRGRVHEMEDEPSALEVERVTVRRSGKSRVEFSKERSLQDCWMSISSHDEGVKQSTLEGVV